MENLGPFQFTVRRLLLFVAAIAFLCAAFNYGGYSGALVGFLVLLIPLIGANAKGVTRAAQIETGLYLVVVVVAAPVIGTYLAWGIAAIVALASASRLSRQDIKPLLDMSVLSAFCILLSVVVRSESAYWNSYREGRRDARAAEVAGASQWFAQHKLYLTMYCRPHGTFDIRDSQYEGYRRGIEDELADGTGSFALAMDNLKALGCQLDELPNGRGWRVTFPNVQVGDRDLDNLTVIGEVAELSLFGQLNITDKSLKHLERIRGLAWVDVRGTSMTREGFRRARVGQLTSGPCLLQADWIADGAWRDLRKIDAEPVSQLRK